MADAVGVGVETVRYYERRGAVFSDRKLIARDGLIGMLKARKVFFTEIRGGRYMKLQ